MGGVSTAPDFKEPLGDTGIEYGMCAMPGDESIFTFDATGFRQKYQDHVAPFRFLA